MGNLERVNKKNFAASERWYREALDAVERSPEPRPDDKYDVLLNLMSALKPQGKTDQAEQLRAEASKVQVEVLDRNIALDPSDVGLYASRTGARLRVGDVRGALADLSKRVELKPDDSETAYAQCVLSLYLGEVDGYRRARRAMLIRFSDTKSVADGERAAKAHLACGDPGVSIDQLAGLVDRALKSGPLQLRPWFEMTKAMAEYRAGHFESAIAHCEQARDVDRTSAQSTLDVLTAMCHARLGHRPEASQWLERAERAEGRNPPSVSDGEHYALFQLLLKEAKGISGPIPTSVPAPENKSGREST
jgi:tetratricopeptide (TPR) repeat protein